jgi:hypothetical protein
VFKELKIPSFGIGLQKPAETGILYLKNSQALLLALACRSRHFVFKELKIPSFGIGLQKPAETGILYLKNSQALLLAFAYILVFKEFSSSCHF